MIVDIALAVGMLFANAGLLGVHSYKIQQFGDLEHDLVNPTDFAQGLNNMWVWECGLQGVHTVLSLISLARHTMAVKILKFALNVFYGAYLTFKTTSGTYKVDPSAVFNKEFLGKIKGGYLAALAFVSVSLFLNLYALRLAIGDE